MRIPLAATALILAVSCGSPVPTASPSPAATASPTSSAAPSPPTASAIVLAHDRSVLEAGELEEADRYDFTLAAAMFFADRMRHIYVVGFGAVGTDPRVFHATSVDGLSWTVDAADPFANLGLDLGPPGPIPGSVIESDAGWVMYLWGVPKEPGSVSQVYRAIADGPGGPWVADVEPVVPAGEAGEVDDRGLDFPSVVPAGDAWLMTYGANGGDHPNAARVLAARSADGISWEKLGRVMEPMDCGGSDLDFLSNPRTFGSGAGYLTLAVLGNDIAALTSADGLTWECPANGPLFRATEIEGSDRVHTMAAAMDDAGKISVIIEALQYDAQGEVYSNLWLAEVVP